MNMLIFPVINKDWFSTLQILKNAGVGVVAASSIQNALLGDSVFEDHFLLPSIHAPDFQEILLRKIRNFHISGIICPVPSAFLYLKRMYEKGTLPVKLLNTFPIAEISNSLIELKQSAKKILEADQSLHRSDLSLEKVACVLNYTSRIYGESGQEKIAAILRVAQSCPKGDVVEIGALMGRTAFALALSSRFLAIGNVLIIDPWEKRHARQIDSPAIVQKDMVDSWDVDLLKDSFVINLLPFYGGFFNYLRLPSAEAYQQYATVARATSPEFGDIKYAGKIALIHIDGNHDYDMVKNDCLLWIPHIRNNGWLILDDYVWAHGKGPQIMGDWMLENLNKWIKQSFVCDKALFVQFSGAKLHENLKRILSST